MKDGEVLRRGKQNNTAVEETNEKKMNYQKKRLLKIVVHMYQDPSKQ